ncbi:MAG TPA: sialidase family protein [Gemmatimonadaceae bacterium]
MRVRLNHEVAQMRASVIVAMLYTCAVAGAVAGQRGPAIRVVRSQQISVAHPDRPHVESFLAVDPRDSRHMIAASMVVRADGRTGTDGYATFDAGRHWVESRIAPRDSVLALGGDPIVYITRDGTALFGVGTQRGGRSVTAVSRSTDGGRSWSHPQVINYRDRPYMTFDTTGTDLDGTIYIAGLYNGFLLSHSTDDGRSFSYPAIISRDLGGSDPTAPIRGILTDMVVTADGVLVMPFTSRVDMRDSTPRLKKDSVMTDAFRVLVSDDGGRSFFAMREGPRTHWAMNYANSQALGAPRVALDQSRGAFRGRLYLVWTDWDIARHAYVVRLAYSSDIGKTWNISIVSDDTSGHDPGNPAIAVTRDGIVGVIWNDRRDDPRNRCWRLYGAISTDGGASFLPNAKLSTAPTCVNTPRNWVLRTWYQYDHWTEPHRPRPGFGLTAFIPTRFPNGGDTQGLAADADGVFHAAWINGATGTLQLWHTAFAVDSAVVAAVRNQNEQKMAGSADASVPSGRVDVTQELTFIMSDPTIDFTRGTLDVTMRVKNPTRLTVRGPIEVVIDRLETDRSRAMGLANFRVANADRGGGSVGATWVFDAGPDRVLHAGATTPPRVLRFRFDGGVPAEPDGYFEPAFRILARTTSTTGQR